MNPYCNCTETITTALDSRKHVNYVHGMVLGADDLIQDFAYEQNQRHWLARDAVGYGTLSGLRVGVKLCDSKDGTGARVLNAVVSPGSALTPKGQLLRVAPEQCADINAWLKLPETQTGFREAGLAIPDSGTVDAYVVLCFRDCKVDLLPVPGEPCRCEDRAMQPSRILDDFRLELRPRPPEQREEDAIRDFVQWLRQVKFGDPSPISTSIETFLQAIRNAAQEIESPLQSPLDFLYGTPPDSLMIPRGELCDYLRAAMKLWVTELRPRWQARWKEYVGGGCGCHEEERTMEEQAETCLLLARITLQLTDGKVLAEIDATVDDSRRPLVVHLRMLQELLLCAPCCNESTEPPVLDHGFLNGLEGDDHLQYLLVSGGRALTGNLSAGGTNSITQLRQAAANGEAVRFEQAIKVGDEAGGDLALQYPNPRVAALQGNAVSIAAPTTEGQLLTWNNTTREWEPRAAAASGVTIEDVATKLPVVPFVTISRLPNRDRFFVFEIWFHLDVDDESRANLPEILSLPKSNLSIFSEKDLQSAATSPFLEPRKFKTPVQVRRNMFRLEVEPPVDDTDPLFRFIFRLRLMKMQSTPGAPDIPILDWIRKRPLKWIGHNADETITEFFRNPSQAAASYVPVAAGRFRQAGGVAIAPSFGSPTAAPTGTTGNQFLLTFAGYNPSNSYIVKGTPIVKIPSEHADFEVGITNSNSSGIPISIQSSVPSGGFMLDVHQIL